MLVGSTRNRHRRRNRFLGIFAIALLAAIWLGHERASAWFQRHKVQKAGERARAYLNRGDIKQAKLALEIARAADLLDLNALRTAAEIAEIEESPASIGLREQVARLAPDSLADRVAWMSAALRFRQTADAESALASFSPEQRARPEVLRLTAVLEQRLGRASRARAALGELERLQPADVSTAVQLASLDLESEDVALRTAARGRLRQIAAQHADARSIATRELLHDAVARGDPESARHYGDELMAVPGAPFDDFIRRLNVDRIWPGLGSARVRAAVHLRASRNPSDAVQLANWYIATKQAMRALAWLQSLPPDARATPEVATARADALTMIGDWPALFRELETRAWGDVQRATLSGAATAQKLRTAGQPAEALRTWRETVALNQGRPVDLIVLARLASRWGYSVEYAEALRALAESLPDARWPLQRLVAHWHEHGNTAELKRSYDLWRRLHPGDRRIQSDQIMAALLADPGPFVPSLAAEARELHESQPANPYFAVAHAFAIWREGRVEEAITTLEKLPLPERRQPGPALYYGAMLADAGRHEVAREYLALVATERLLPEERKILGAACRLAVAAEPSSANRP